MISNNNANLYLVFIKKINKKNNVFILFAQAANAQNY